MIMKKIGSTAARSELEIWIRKCIESHELYGPECYRAWEPSGIPSDEFDKKITAEWSRR